MDTKKETTVDATIEESSNTATDENITLDNDSSLFDKTVSSNMNSVLKRESNTDEACKETTAATSDDHEKNSTSIDNNTGDFVSVSENDVKRPIANEDGKNDVSDTRPTVKDEVVKLSTSNNVDERISKDNDDNIEISTIDEVTVKRSTSSENIAVESSISSDVIPESSSMESDNLTNSVDNVAAENSTMVENETDVLRNEGDKTDTTNLSANNTSYVASDSSSLINTIDVESSDVSISRDPCEEVLKNKTVANVDISEVPEVSFQHVNVKSEGKSESVDVSKIDQSIIMTGGSPILLDSSTLTLPDNSEGIFLIQTTDSGVTETHVIARMPENISSTEYVYTNQITDVLTKLCTQDELTEPNTSDTTRTDLCTNKHVTESKQQKYSRLGGESTVPTKSSVCSENSDENVHEIIQIDEQIDQTDTNDVFMCKTESDIEEDKNNTTLQDPVSQLTDSKCSFTTKGKMKSKEVSNGNVDVLNRANNDNIKFLVANVLETSIEEKSKTKQISETRKELKVNSIPNIAQTIVSDWTFDDHYENDENSKTMTIIKPSDTSDSYDVEIVVHLDNTEGSSHGRSASIVELKEKNLDLVTLPFVVSDNKPILNRINVDEDSYEGDVFRASSQKKLTLDDITKEIQETEQKESESEKNINNNDNTISLKEVVLDESQSYEILTDLTVIDPEVHQSESDTVPVTLISINDDYEIEESDAIDKHRRAVAKESLSPGSKQTRPSTSDGVPIPCHLMGRTLENPQEDLVCNGRMPPKPRLGVKVPYRYLTSQICSKDEIAREIIAKNTVEQPDVPNTGDVFFVKKLFHNLAKKILSPEERKNLDPTLNEDEPKTVAKSKTAQTSSKSSVKRSQEKGIAERLRSLDGGNIKSTAKNVAVERKSPKATLKKEKKPTVTDQELLAILEGNVNIKMSDLPRRKTSSPPILTPENMTVSQNREISDTPPVLEPVDITRKQPSEEIATSVDLDSETIRRLALKQLSELPCGKRSKKEQPIVIKRPRGRPRKHPKLPKKPVENFVVDPDDPFAFDENSRPSELPKYEPLVPPRVLKTYGKKTDKDEMEPENIIIPKEILDIEIENCKFETDTEETDKSELSKDASENVKSADIVVDVKKSKPESEEKIKVDERQKKIVHSKKQQFKKGNKVILRKENLSDRPFVLTSKRARVIKRKVIWDPDEAQPVRTIMQKKSMKKSETEEASTVDETRNVRRPTSKRSILSRESFKNAKRKLMKRLHGRKFVKKFAISKGSRVSVLTTNLAVKKRPKKMSELDRLLMDEGALNMLYSIERDGDTSTIKDRQRVISIDKFEREMNKKKRAVMTVLSTTPDASPKILRKKESPSTSVMSGNAPVRKRSRDSQHGSVHTPPPSPGLMFPPRAEASRIIRRHSSSSSFSSGCTSPRRLSVTDLERKTTSNETETKSDVNETSTEHPDESSSNEHRCGSSVNVNRKERKTLSAKKKSAVSEENEVFAVDGSEDSSSRKSTGKMAVVKERTLTRKRKLDESAVFGEVKTMKTDRVESEDNIESQVQIIVEGDVEKTKTASIKQEPRERQNVESKEYEEISLRRFDRLVQIILTPTVTKRGHFLSIQAMQELSDALNTLGQDKSCRTVLLTSTGNIFCKGIDYSFLIRPSLDERKKVAKEMIKSIRELVHAVAAFPYPLVAGVQGAASGLGVALLPLCDLVLVSDRATFSMPYAKLGCIPEAAATTTLSHVTSLAVTSELLLAGHTITAAEALRHGLASRVLWPDNFQKELIPICNGIAAQSVQSMNVMKKLLRQSLLSKVNVAMDAECDLIIDQWISEECQHNFEAIIDQNNW